NEMSLLDLWKESGKQVVWSRKVATDSKACVVQREAVGLFEPGGKFVLLNLADGKPIAEEQLEAENPLNAIYILRSSEQYLLVTDSPPARRLTIAPVANINYNPV